MRFTELKRTASLANLKKAAESVARYTASLPVWTCRQCGIEKPGTVHQRRQTFCSNTCRYQDMHTSMLGANNPHYSNAGLRICGHCGCEYRSYNKTRKFCSHPCYRKAEGLVRGRLRKDANHASLVETMEKLGGLVIDMSRLGNGVPDVAVWTRIGWQVAEIKNPDNYYGRKGLNKAQREWASHQKAPVYIIRTIEDATNLVLGKLEHLQHDEFLAP